MNTSTDDATLVAEFARAHLPLASAQLPDEYYYQSLPLCVIDAVYSIGVRYSGVKNVVRRYCNHFGLQQFRSDRRNLPEPASQEPLTGLCERFAALGIERMAKEVFANRQRTSVRNGLLKAEAVSLFAAALRTHGIEFLQDVQSNAHGAELERDVRCIPGQGSGISLAYFRMLAGSDALVKPDRMVLRFIQSALGRTLAVAEVQPLLERVAELLKSTVPSMSPRLLDYAIWNYQRVTGGLASMVLP
ncbi:MAG: hypothetical protein ABI885_22715 [Gammaproteobacteria bacterium]